MQKFDNKNSGVLFKNTAKQKNNHPDYRGHINVDGVEYWLSAWVKQSEKDGKKFFSLAIKPQGEQEKKPALLKKPLDIDEDDIYFN